VDTGGCQRPPDAVREEPAPVDLKPRAWRRLRRDRNGKKQTNLASLAAGGVRGSHDKLDYSAGHSRRAPSARSSAWNAASSAGRSRTARGGRPRRREKEARAPAASPIDHSTGWRR
jgi:hypothetical protein